MLKFSGTLWSQIFLLLLFFLFLQSSRPQCWWQTLITSITSTMFISSVSMNKWRTRHSVKFNPKHTTTDFPYTFNCLGKLKKTHNWEWCWHKLLWFQKTSMTPVDTFPKIPLLPIVHLGDNSLNKLLIIQMSHNDASMRPSGYFLFNTMAMGNTILTTCKRI